MPTLDATLSGANANSYAAVSEADDYFDNTLDHASWAGLMPDDKARALIQATGMLEVLLYWGEPASATQALKFPRIYAPAYDGTSIPPEVKAALYELALDRALRATGAGQAASTDTYEKLRAAGITSYKLGDLALSFQPGSVSSTSGILSQFPARTQRLISRWVKTGGKMLTERNNPYGRDFTMSLGWQLDS